MLKRSIVSSRLRTETCDICVPNLQLADIYSQRSYIYDNIASAYEE